jgi:hypothetical protein
MWLVDHRYLTIGGFLALFLKLKLFNLTGIAGGSLFPSLRSGTYPKGDQQQTAAPEEAAVRTVKLFT